MERSPGEQIPSLSHNGNASVGSRQIFLLHWGSLSICRMGLASTGSFKNPIGFYRHKLPSTVASMKMLPTKSPSIGLEESPSKPVPCRHSMKETLQSANSRALCTCMMMLCRGSTLERSNKEKNTRFFVSSFSVP